MSCAVSVLSSSCRWLAGSVLSLLVLSAHAAGGHHAVDDASLLEPGQCAFETWAERQTNGDRTLVHVGPSCRVGAVELGLNVDREKLRGTPAQTVLGPQLKWAHDLSDAFSVGAVAGVGFGTGSSNSVTTTLVVPVTWRIAPGWSAHANYGRDLPRHERSQVRGGVALEWSPTDAWSFIGERFAQAGAHSARLGVRWSVTPDVAVDISHARTLGAPGVRWVTVGLNWAFEPMRKAN